MALLERLPRQHPRASPCADGNIIGADDPFAGVVTAQCTAHGLPSIGERT
jgi:hypothetical protein